MLIFGASTENMLDCQSVFTVFTRRGVIFVKKISMC